MVDLETIAIVYSYDIMQVQPEEEEERLLKQMKKLGIN